MCIDKIINEHKEGISATEKEIEQLKVQYQKEALDNKQFYENGEIVDPDMGNDNYMQKSQIENDKIMIKERELTTLKNSLLIDEESYLKLSKMLQDSCSTVSRIMYQLEPQDVIIFPPIFTEG